jgi:tetratricopeptide (TPR) repeat protein
MRKSKKLKYKRLALAYSKQLKVWARKGNPNVVHYVSFINAEIKSWSKASFPDSVKLFKEAITLAREQGILHDQALANERLGDLYLHHKLESDALRHFQEAIYLYNKWGSVARRDSALKKRDGNFMKQPHVSILSSPAKINSTFFK